MDQQGDVTYAQVAFDPQGRPLLIMPEEQQSNVLNGVEAKRVNANVAKSLFNRLKTSFGPRGMDKIIIDQDGDVTVTNDGACFLKSIDIDNHAIKLLVELSQSQDDESGDGTTSVVLFAAALISQGVTLIEKGIKPQVVMDGFSYAASKVVDYLTSVCDSIDISKPEQMYPSIQTTLSSKIVSQQKKIFAKLAVDAVRSVADFERKDVDFEQIKIIKRVGESFENSRLIKGIVLEKHFSHPQMPEKIENPKIAILTCPFEPPKLKTKHKLELKSAESYKDLQKYEVDVFKGMIDSIKKTDANVVICQWGFDDEANHLLYSNGLPAIRWVGGPDIELISLATNARIVPLFSQLSNKKLGTCKSIRTESLGVTENDKVLVFEECSNSQAVTVVLHGSNKQLVDEVQRSFIDAISVTRNLIRDPRIVYGGASSEMRASVYLDKISDPSNPEITSPEKSLCIRAFSEALMEIPLILAENSGLDSKSIVAKLKAKIFEGGNSRWLGVDALQKGTDDMKEQKVVESLAQKCQQIMQATEVFRSIIKVDTVRMVEF